VQIQDEPWQERAGSEAKRLGSAPEELGALFVACAKRWPETVAEIAPGQVTEFEGLLRSGARFGEPESVRAFLDHARTEGISDAEAFVKALLAELATTEPHHGDAAATPSTPAASEAPEPPQSGALPKSATAAPSPPIVFDAAASAIALKQAVVGQEGAIDVLCRRLAVTRAGVDAHPERPDGVFLFVGPTGVGKTKLASALAGQLFGSADALIRLDMSEYHDDWAISRLTGPPPGYHGNDQPSSWLTTKVSEKPHVVILLDEVEKANPAVWNVFLQVFDYGRLTDGRGVTADFSNAVIIMTSNLGASAFTKAKLGFGTSSDRNPGEGASDVRRAVERTMAPEIVNRLDAVVVFEPLDRDAVCEIANQQINELKKRLSQRDLTLTLDDDVVEFVVDQGFDPRYGARNLMRTIEQHLLEPLLWHGARTATVAVGDGALAWDFGETAV